VPFALILPKCGRKTSLPPPKRAVFAICGRSAHSRDNGEDDAMTIVRRLLAGLTVIAAMTATDASAQDCPEWLKWICPDSASSNPAAKDAVQSGSAAGQRTKQTRPVPADTATNPQSRQTQAAEPARAAKAARPTRSGDPSDDRRLARQGERQGARLDPAMSDQEKDALFQEFLVWQARRPNAAANR
jgi:hypothetical protein